VRGTWLSDHGLLASGRMPVLPPKKMTVIRAIKPHIAFFLNRLSQVARTIDSCPGSFPISPRLGVRRNVARRQKRLCEPAQNGRSIDAARL